jgi:hypothetical protein
VLSVWREVRRDERQEPADWRSTREGFVAIKGRAKRFAPTAASASGMFGRLHETVAHFRAGKAIGDGRDRHSILVRHMGVSLVVTATNNTYSCSTRLPERRAAPSTA